MRPRLTRRLLLGALALAVLAGAGCDQKSEYAGTLASYNQSLFEAGKKFGQTMAPALQNGTVNTAEMRQAYDELVETLDAVKKDFATLKTPQTPAGKRLAAGYEKFLRGQSTMIRNDLGRIVRTVQRNPKDRSARDLIVNTMQTLVQREQASGRELQKLLDDFAKEPSKAR
jgi:hypothetical protein